MKKTTFRNRIVIGSACAISSPLMAYTVCGFDDVLYVSKRLTTTGFNQLAAKNRLELCDKERKKYTAQPEDYKILFALYDQYLARESRDLDSGRNRSNSRKWIVEEIKNANFSSDHVKEFILRKFPSNHKTDDSLRRVKPYCSRANFIKKVGYMEEVESHWWTFSDEEYEFNVRNGFKEIIHEFSSLCHPVTGYNNQEMVNLAHELNGLKKSEYVEYIEIGTSAPLRKEHTAREALTGAIEDLLEAYPH